MTTNVVKDKFCPVINDFCRKDCVNFRLNYTEFNLVTSTRVYDKLYDMITESWLGMVKEKSVYAVTVREHTSTLHSKTKYYSCRELGNIKTFDTKLTTLKTPIVEVVEDRWDIHGMPKLLRASISKKENVAHTIGNERMDEHDPPLPIYKVKRKYE